MKAIYHLFSSLIMTVVLLALSMALVFFGTLDQVNLGIYQAQKVYFESFFAVWQFPANVPLGQALRWIHIPLPGGYLIGALLLINLTAAHFRYFKPGWKKTGIVIIHGGISLLLISGFLTSWMQKESQMRIDEKDRSNYSSDIRTNELVIIDKSAPDTDTVTRIPPGLLETGNSVPLPDLDLTVEIREYMPNARISLASQNPNAKPVAVTQGAGVKMGLAVTPAPITYKPDEVNTATAIVDLISPDGSIGSWLVSNFLDDRFPPQKFQYQGKDYEIALRFNRTYYPFWITLNDFTHDRYPGTNIPKNFSSDISIDNTATGEKRDALIYMNHPLRYEGLTFFQQSFANDDTTSIFQVVRNPGWRLPYLAVLMVGVGMLIQFTISLFRHSSKKTTRNAPVTPQGLIIPSILFIIGLAMVARGAMPPKYDSEFDVASFAKLPIQTGGRVMPLDTLARNSMVLMRGKQTVEIPKENESSDTIKMPAISFFMELFFRPENAAELKVFRIDNDEVLGLFGWEQSDEMHFSFNELRPFFPKIEEQARKAGDKESKLRTVFEKQIIKLYHAISSYQELTLMVHPRQDLDRIVKTYEGWQAIIPKGIDAFEKKRANEAFDEETLRLFESSADRFIRLSDFAKIGIVPPRTEPAKEENDWHNVGEGILLTISTEALDPIVYGYAKLTEAYRNNNPTAFNAALADMHAELAKFSSQKRVNYEEFFNTSQPFVQAIALYVLIFIIIGISWLKWEGPLQRGAFWLLVLAFVVHTFGLASRMFIQERPPVTNLYSSAIFVGWAATLLSIILERSFRNGIGSFVAAFVGICTLIIAHNLAKTGDTLEMMRAVLDSNFWLATHVIVITAGYSSMFLAGAIGIAYVFFALFSSKLNKENTRSLYGMVYGITCFSALFSFVGTMLGGIWADQSWGRFWGWDPKENGALLIVLWCAIMLHARWGGICRARGFMLMAIFGNVITSFSWFGTNMLGIGLHSYGFMDAAFFWLMAFCASQMLIIAIGFLPTSSAKHASTKSMPQEATVS